MNKLINDMTKIVSFKHTFPLSPLINVSEVELDIGCNKNVQRNCQ